jgi:hypothetical protein
MHIYIYTRINIHECIYVCTLTHIHIHTYIHTYIAQAVSRRLPTAAARIRAQVRTYVICGGQSGRFSPRTSISYEFSFHRLLHTHHLSPRTGTIGQIVTDVPSGVSLTSPQETKRNAIPLHSGGVLFKSRVENQMLIILCRPSRQLLGL